VVVLESLDLPIIQDTTRWLRFQLGVRGFDNVSEIRYRIVNLKGQPAAAEAALKAIMAAERPDVVVTVATLAARAARPLLKDSGIPQLFAIVADPVGEGFAPGIGRPSGSNISGRTHVLSADTVLSQLARTLARPAERPFRIALLSTSYPSSIASRDELLAAQAEHPGIALEAVDIAFRPKAADRAALLDEAVERIAAAPERFEGIWIATGPLSHDTAFHRALTGRTGLPLVFGETIEAVADGALLGLMSEAETNGRAIGDMAADVLQGVPVASMPVERPGTFMAAVNIATAIRLEVGVPSELVELAGSHIYR
jgi:putative ABC transport system substrate-binding protein